MRRPTSALALAFLGTALAGTTALAQQSAPGLTNGAGGPSSAPNLASDPMANPMNPARGARYLLRNGWDYITYQQYERALGFFREAEQREFELSDREKLQLKQGLDRAQRGMRELATGMSTEPAYAKSGPPTRPGSLALGTQTPAARPAAPAPATTKVAAAPIEREPIQLASATSTEASEKAANLRPSSPLPASMNRVAPASLPPATEIETVPDVTMAAADTAPSPVLPPLPAPVAIAPADPARLSDPAPVAAPEPAEGSTSGIAPASTAPPLPLTQDAPPTGVIPAGAPAPVAAPMPAAPPIPAATPVPAAVLKPEVAASKGPELTPPPDDIPLPQLPGEPVAAEPATISAPASVSEASAESPKAATPASEKASASDASTVTVAAVELPSPVPTQGPASNPVAEPAPSHPPVDKPGTVGAATAAVALAEPPASAPSPNPAPAAVGEPNTEIEKLPPLPEGIGEPSHSPASAPEPLPAPVSPAGVTEPAPNRSPAPTTESMPEPAPLPNPTAIAVPAEPPAVPSNGTEPVPAVSSGGVIVLPDSPPAPAAATPDPAPAPRAMTPTPAPVAVPAASVPGVEPPPAPPASEVTPRGRFGVDTLIPERRVDDRPSTLTPELRREVEEIAQRQEEELRRNPNPPGTAPPSTAPADAPGASTGGPSSTRLEISRAPSPTEARPIRAIPVPEEFVPLPKREWQPNRKYWSAAATCHLPLYFHDATLERYGYSMEQRFGRAGRYMSIPIDDPRQSNQRNQIVQPFFSAGLFAAQIALLPYNMIMDPPWEAEYDLGYYRPGDRVPTDVYYLPWTGVGPPLRGKNYGNAPSQGVALPASRW